MYNSQSLKVLLKLHRLYISWWILAVLRQLLETPESDSPLEVEIGELYRTDIEKFKKTAQEYTKRYAM